MRRKRKPVSIPYTGTEAERYERQLWMKSIGTAGQARLGNASVLVVGAGGLGSPILLYLAAAGVGTLGIVDTVGLSNLNRQILYVSADIGQPKALLAKDRLLALNPDIRVEAYPARLAPDNAYALFGAYDLIVDATDNYPSRYLISDAAVLYAKPLFIGAVSSLHGMALTVIPHKTACFRCLYPTPPTRDMARQEHDQGVLGTITGIVGALVAQNVLKYITGIGDWLEGKLVLIDGENNRFETIAVTRDSTCSVCGDNPIVTELIPIRTDPSENSC